MTGSQIGRWLRRAGSLAICLFVWQMASTLKVDFGVLTFANVPSPGDVVTAAFEFIRSPRLFAHVSSSLGRVFAGYAIAAVVGVSFGLVIGRLRIVGDFLQTPLELLRPIPAVAWIPLAVLMFPSSELSMIFITFTGALFPILINTVHGVESVDPRLIASARSLGSTRSAMLLEVIIPGAAPNIVTGLVIGMGSSWFCLVTAEMISGQFGIGYYTWESYTLQNYPEIIVGMIVIGLLGMASSALLKAAGVALLPWNSKEG
ncbi:ABC transporter permease [Mesorhizobium sp.]|uniref:ABC transporter permease n=1 Tax=Mesorhizobium sp. TaxID=1871066 RepID=UPI000FE377DA|nr:ABC transporter permease [Mesorhizobium sp.]RWN51493.1 MAG: ABC transporter permease [Mesorhizobium sp.]RWN72186.1 MAG: ABC transporter permease [Mesorhizobium sp.]RWN73407.1 MAG: ABC transporter permease [Mesorhizobium sp.]RWN85718.1 MAG: ABC transporter permease [Mesorhizobium sp.]RWO09448.1 MAG: ABC transporter permease [Mesorhizobium sp.]